MRREKLNAAMPATGAAKRSRYVLTDQPGFLLRVAPIPKSILALPLA
jgi:hypothetical protein